MSERICSAENCETKLSAYNALDSCHAHSAMLRMPELHRTANRGTGEITQGNQLPRRYRDYLPAWAPKANCAGMELEAFFSEETSAGELTSPVIAAKAVCWDCPFRRECAEWAFQVEDQEFREGVFAGSTGPERQRFAHRKDPVRSLMAFLTKQADEIPGIKPQARQVLYRSPTFFQRGEASVA